MRASWILARLLAMLLIALPASSALAITITPFDHPSGVGSTRLIGVSGQNILGRYYTGQTPVDFIYDGSTYTTLLPFPDPSYQFTPYGIDGSKVVGTLRYTLDLGMTLVQRDYGAVYDGSSYTKFNHPLDDGNTTFATGIEGNTVVGYYVQSGADVRGYSYDGSTFTSFRVPLGGSKFASTVPYDIDGGLIVGEYSSSGHGFVYDGTAFTTIDTAGPQTTIHGISGDDLVGFQRDSKSNLRAFWYDGSVFTALEPPGVKYGFVTGAVARGIDDNTMVGYYNIGGGQTRGFIATIPEPSTLALLGLILPALGWVMGRRVRHR
jgi:hypothetical protein